MRNPERNQDRIKVEEVALIYQDSENYNTSIGNSEDTNHLEKIAGNLK